MTSTSFWTRIQSKIHPAHWMIRTKIVAIILFVAITSIFAISIFYFVNMTNININNTGDTLLNYSKDSQLRVEEIFQNNINALLALSSSPNIMQAVEEANTVYPKQDKQQLAAKIAQMDQQWKDHDPQI